MQDFGVVSRTHQNQMPESVLIRTVSIDISALTETQTTKKLKWSRFDYPNVMIGLSNCSAALEIESHPCLREYKEMELILLSTVLVNTSMPNMPTSQKKERLTSVPLPDEDTCIVAMSWQFSPSLVSLILHDDRRIFSEFYRRLLCSRILIDAAAIALVNKKNFLTRALIVLLGPSAATAGDTHALLWAHDIRHDSTFMIIYP